MIRLSTATETYASLLSVWLHMLYSKTIGIGIVSNEYYPTLGCDIQGFGAMGLSVQY